MAKSEQKSKIEEKKFNQTEYTKNYHKEHYYRFNVVLAKEYKNVITEAAEAAGQSKNAWIKSLIDEKLNLK